MARIATAARRLGRQRGQATVELAAMMGLLLVAALFAWQMSLVGSTDTNVYNAARTASRVAGRGGDGVKAGLMSLSSDLRAHATVVVQPADGGYEAIVTVPLPSVMPGFDALGFKVRREVTLPTTSAPVL